MKKTLFAVFLSFTALFIAGCCMSGKKDVKITFTDAERQWLIYKLNDTLTFISNEQEREQFVVNEIDQDTFPRFDKFGSGCENRFTEKYTVRFSKFPADTAYHSFYIGFFTDSFSSSIDWYSYTDTDFDELPLNSVTINNINYTDVWEKTIVNGNANGNYITLTYSKSKGLLKYVFKNGKEFTRVIN